MTTELQDTIAAALDRALGGFAPPTPAGNRRAQGGVPPAPDPVQGRDDAGLAENVAESADRREDDEEEREDRREDRRKDRKIAKTSVADRLRALAARLAKARPDDADPDDEDGEEPPQPARVVRLRDTEDQIDDRDDEEGEDRGDEGEEEEENEDGDAELHAALATIRRHPRVLRAIAEAVTEALVQQAEAEEGGDEREMRRALDRADDLVKALAEADDDGQLRKALAEQPVTAAFAEAFIDLGGQMLARIEATEALAKAARDELQRLRETVESMGEVQIAVAKQTTALRKAVEAEPRQPFPGVFATGAPPPAPRAGVPDKIDPRALSKALEDDAVARQNARAFDALILVPTNPQAAYLMLTDEGKQEYQRLARG